MPHSNGAESTAACSAVCSAPESGEGDRPVASHPFPSIPIHSHPSTSDRPPYPVGTRVNRQSPLQRPRSGQLAPETSPQGAHHRQPSTTSLTACPTVPTRPGRAQALLRPKTVVASVTSEQSPLVSPTPASAVSCPGAHSQHPPCPLQRGRAPHGYAPPSQLTVPPLHLA